MRTHTGGHQRTWISWNYIKKKTTNKHGGGCVMVWKCVSIIDVLFNSVFNHNHSPRSSCSSVEQSQEVRLVWNQDLNLIRITLNSCFCCWINLNVTNLHRDQKESYLVITTHNHKFKNKALHLHTSKYQQVHFSPLWIVYAKVFAVIIYIIIIDKAFLKWWEQNLGYGSWTKVLVWL